MLSALVVSSLNEHVSTLSSIFHTESYALFEPDKTRLYWFF